MQFFQTIITEAFDSLPVVKKLNCTRCVIQKHKSGIKAAAILSLAVEVPFVRLKKMQEIYTLYAYLLCSDVTVSYCHLACACFLRQKRCLAFFDAGLLTRLLKCKTKVSLILRF